MNRIFAFAIGAALAALSVAPALAQRDAAEPPTYQAVACAPAGWQTPCYNDGTVVAPTEAR